MNVAVASLPSIEGRKFRGPAASVTIATTPTMTTSRLMTKTVSQSGRWLVSGTPGSVRMTNVVTSSSLSAIGSSHRAKAGALTGAAGDEAVKRVRDTRGQKDDQRPPQIAVDDQQHERPESG